MKSAVKALAGLALLSFAAPAQATFDTAARAALVVDMTSGAVLLEKNADEALPPASMSKLMTLNMVFEALKDGRLSMDDRFRVSKKASDKGGSRMFTREGDSIRIEDLIRGVVVQSGNDACIVLAEGLAGSEEAFAERMNQRARELGMSGSSFANSTGWPDPDQMMSTRDLMFLTRRMIEQFPDYYEYFNETVFEWDGVRQKNRNPLLYLDIGADGLKTGHTEAAGYGLVGSAVREGRRVAFVIRGLDSVKARSLESERLITWAFREFRTGTVAAAGQIVGEADVWIGDEPVVPLALESDVIATAPWGSLDEVKSTVRFDGPIAAPIAMGERIGELVIEAPGLGAVSAPLVAASSVEKGGVVTRVGAVIQTLLAREGGITAAPPTADSAD